jgi:uncharacterized protein YecT (DUF1311 family)
MKRIFTLVALSFSSLAFSASEFIDEDGTLVLNSGPSCDMNRCALPSSGVADTYCAQSLIAQEDKKLNEIYSAVRKDLSKSHKRLLTRAQVSWIQTRDKTMKLNQEIAANWRVYTVGTYIQECNITKHRNAELQSTYDLLQDQKE